MRIAFLSREPMPTNMARINLIHPIDSISGAFVKRERVYYRTRNGRTHAYKVIHPYKGEASAAQSAGRQSFGDCVRQASAILHDAEQRAEWQTRYDAYRKKVERYPNSYPHPCGSLYAFIISTLRQSE